MFWKNYILFILYALSSIEFEKNTWIDMKKQKQWDFCLNFLFKINLNCYTKHYIKIFLNCYEIYS